MRAVLDTNIIVSALIAPAGTAAAIIDVWLQGRFTILTCAAHIDELRSTLSKAARGRTRQTTQGRTPS